MRQIRRKTNGAGRCLSLFEEMFSAGDWTCLLWVVIVAHSGWQTRIQFYYILHREP